MQTAHAVADFAIEHSEQFKAWQKGSNYLCCLCVETEESIKGLIEELKFFNIKHTVFKEPDIDNQITAVAVESLPEKLHKKFFKNLKLTMS